MCIRDRYDLERRVFGIAVKKQRIEEIIPVKYRIIENQYGNDRLGQRQNHLYKIIEMGTAVQHCCLIQILRYGIFNECPRNDQVIGIDRHKYDEYCFGGYQPQRTHRHIEGNKPAAEKHGKNKIKHHLVSRLEIPPG